LLKFIKNKILPGIPSASAEGVQQSLHSPGLEDGNPPGLLHPKRAVSFAEGARSGGGIQSTSASTEQNFPIFCKILEYLIKINYRTWNWQIFKKKTYHHIQAAVRCVKCAYPPSLFAILLYHVQACSIYLMYCTIVHIL